MSDRYVYEDEHGSAVYSVVRSPGKKFRQERADGVGEWKLGRGETKSVPYHLPEILTGIDQGKPIYICEGEKDVEAARLQGVIATTNSGGAGKWTDEHSYWLRAAEPVIIIWDRDEKGRQHALDVEASLRRAGISDITFRRAAVGKDLSDHIEAGYTMAQLVAKRPIAPITEARAEDKETDDELLHPAFQLALMRLQKVTPEYGKQNQYNALCPAHDDTHPSLSIKPGDDVAVMVTCHANGCSPAAIARALGMHPKHFTITGERGSQEWHNEQAYMRKVANEHADQRIMQERAREIVRFAALEETLVDELAKPLVPTKWFIDSWFKSATAVLLNADPKAGKTRLALNLVKACVENEPFLGRFQTNLAKDARIWYGNWDQPEELMREYLHDYQWLAAERVIMQHIGSMEFPFWVPTVFDDFVAYAKRMNIKLMVVDTLHVASQGFVTNENDNNEVSAFVHLLRKLCKAADIDNLLVIHHTGHTAAGRGRGASTLAADFDGMWFLHTSDSERFDSPRSLSAKGRKLGVEPIDLVYNVATESYTYGGKLPAKAGSNTVDPDLMAEYVELADRIADYHTSTGAWPDGRLARKWTHKKNGTPQTEFLKAAESLGLIRKVVMAKVGPGRARVEYRV